jgi:cardiolipin synthase
MRLQLPSAPDGCVSAALPWHLAAALPRPPISLAAGGDAAFPLILRRIAEARRSIDVRAYIWRDDDTGRTMARALLAAADRGVAVSIAKDRDAASYEFSERTGRSLLHPDLRPYDRLESAFLSTVYSGRPVRREPGPSAEGDALRAHSNVRLDIGRRYDHAKVYVFDERRIVLGGMGIGDEARHDTIDYMVDLEGPCLVERYRARRSGQADFDPVRSIDFLLHERATHGVSAPPLRRDRLGLLAAARRSLVVEMAYFGDDAFVDALVDAVGRGVETTVVASRRASILRHLNHAALDRLLVRTGAPAHLGVYLVDAEVHAKVVVVDGAAVDLGSANFSPLSHGIYDEVNVHVRDTSLAARLTAEIRKHAATGERQGGRLHHRRSLAIVEAWLMARHARQAARRATAAPRA